jgi:hypothetical protein
MTQVGKTLNEMIKQIAHSILAITKLAEDSKKQPMMFKAYFDAAVQIVENGVGRMSYEEDRLDFADFLSLAYLENFPEHASPSLDVEILTEQDQKRHAAFGELFRHRPNFDVTAHESGQRQSATFKAAVAEDLEELRLICVQLAPCWNDLLRYHIDQPGIISAYDRMKMKISDILDGMDLEFQKEDMAVMAPC